MWSGFFFSINLSAEVDNGMSIALYVGGWGGYLICLLAMNLIQYAMKFIIAE